jgi:glycosyltransferase involved in cell wall biosynthesis
MQPLVSIVMPCFNERGHIEACLRSVAEQDYPRERIEILVADGMSTDGTRDILERLRREDPRIRVIDNPARLQAPGLNEAIRAARGDLILRMDVHADYAADYITQCVHVLEETGADNVGGAARPRAKGTFQRVLCAALGSPLAVGGASYRIADSEGWVDTIFPGAFRRSVFERVGLFDPGAVTNEDAEINERLRASGGRIYQSRRIVVHYYPRSSLRSLARQYFRYGQGRARTVLKHRRASPRAMAPFGLTMFTLAATPLFPPAAAAVLGIYALATGAEAARVAWRERMPTAQPLVWLIFSVLHYAHGAGFAAGLIKYAARPDWRAPELLPPRTAGATV